MDHEREELVELFGAHLERMYNIPPLAGRIQAVIIIDGCKSGITFDAILDKIKASKSSVSTNLNLLLKMGKIEYFTLTGDRKKYFKSPPFSQRLKNYLLMVENEKILVDKLIAFRKKNRTCKQEEVNYENMCAYKEHVSEVEQLFKSTISKLKKIETKNQLVK